MEIPGAGGKKGRMKPPIFIVGPHRSGSTLWHNLVSMCPGVMRLTDPRFLSDRAHRDFRYFLKTQIGDLSVNENVEKMVELCLSRRNLPGLDSTFWSFKSIPVADTRELKREIVSRIKASDRSLGAIARIIVEEITQWSGCEQACVKFPVDVGHISELMEWFPDCRVMHITRDPRAMAMSKSNDPYGTALRILKHPRLAWLIRKMMIGVVIANYRETARIHRRFRNVPNYRLFRYEDLLAEPEKTLRDLCAFIDVEFNADLLHPEKGQHEHQRSSITGKQRKAFDPTAAVHWQQVISPFAESVITILTRSSMRALGYDPDKHPIFSNKHESSATLCEAAP